MSFTHEKVAEDLFLLRPTSFDDVRGSFFRLFDGSAFDLLTRPPVSPVPQVSVSYNLKRNTLRGLHFQREPFKESKLIHVSRGNIFDLVVNIDPSSENFGRTYDFKLSAGMQTLLLIGPSYAHGFITLEDNTEIIYFIDGDYVPEYADGVNFFDRSFLPLLPKGICLKNVIISDRDLSLKKLDEIK